MNFIIILVICLSVDNILSFCPDWDLITPCHCEDDDIYCNNSTDSKEMAMIFENLTNSLPYDEQHFDNVLIMNELITDLTQNQFSNITFDGITIEECPQLATIDDNAFGVNTMVTTYLSMDSMPNLRISSESFFAILSKFEKIEKIKIFDVNIDKIPTGAFKSNQDKLKSLEFIGPSIKYIENNAFSSLKNLKSITLRNTSIERFEEKAFHMEKSNSRLIIYFDTNPLINASSFVSGTLLNINRPVLLILMDMESPWTYLDETVFKPFFLQNPGQNTVYFQFNCSDIRNHWMNKVKGMSLPACPK